MTAGGVVVGTAVRIGVVSLLVGGLAAMLAPGQGPARSWPVAARPLEGRAQVDELPISSRDVALTVRGRAVPARLVAPEGGARAAVVFVHGSGVGTAAGGEAWARALARSGVAVLVPDKVMAGYTMTQRDYAALADDAHAEVAWLVAELSLPWDRVGLLGVSEGGWVSLLAAVRHPDLSGPLLLDSGPVVTPLEQVAFAATNGAVALPDALTRLVTGFMAAGRPFIDYLDHDARRHMARVGNRVVAVFGTEDRTVPLGQAITRLREGLPREPTVLLVPGGHAPAPDPWAPLVAGELVDPARAVPSGTWTLSGARIDAALERGAPVPPTPSALLDPRLHLAVSAALVLVGRLLPRRHQPGEQP